MCFGDGPSFQIVSFFNQCLCIKYLVILFLPVSILRQSRRLYGSRAPQRGPAATQSQNHKLQAAMLMAGALE